MAKLTKEQKVGVGFGIFGLITAVVAAIRAKAAPEIQLSNLIISPIEVNPRQEVTISVRAINKSATTLSRTIFLGGDFMAEQLVELGPGESQVVSFTVVPTEVKIHFVSVDGLEGSFVCTEAPVADIRVENLIIIPEVCYVGEEVTISVQATNYGTIAGSRTIICEIT